MIGDLRQASHMLRPIDAINGVKNWRRRISILKQALEINCDLKAISGKEADMIGRSPTFPSSISSFRSKKSTLHQGSSGLEMLGG